MLLSFLILILAPAGSLSRAQVEQPVSGQHYFPETGHWVTGNFWSFYQSIPDPQRIYGYPITDAFQDSMTGEVVQYFQRARFELHPEAPVELRVQLTPLGKLLYNPAPAIEAPVILPACRLYSETGFRVCYAFLDFFDAHGGVSQFGYPISNFEIRNERIVQYFQRARLEWRPDQEGTGNWVGITDLGTEYFRVRGENQVRLLVNRNNMPQTILSLRVNAFPKKSVTPLSDEQTIYVVVQDQNRSPVANADVVVFFLTPSGEQGRIMLPATNELGLSQGTFQFNTRQQGMARIWVVVNYENLQQQTSSTFRIWW